MTPVERRFWKKVSISLFDADACWPWTGGGLPKGYGFFHYQGKNALAHRVAYELATGDAPGDAMVLHTCDNPPCCNPAHLRAGTQLDNMSDKRAKRRGKFPCLTDDQAYRVKFGGEKGCVLAEEFGVTTAAISRIRTGVTYRWLQHDTPQLTARPSSRAQGPGSAVAPASRSTSPPDTP